MEVIKEALKGRVDGLLRVLQAIKDGKPIECRMIGRGCWEDFDPERDNFDVSLFEYRIKSGANGVYIADYPDKRSDENVEFSLLEEGKIYRIECTVASLRLDYGYILIRKKYVDSTLGAHFAVYVEQNGTIVHIGDPEANAYQSVASQECSNQIYSNIGLGQHGEYLFYLPSKQEVKDIVALISRLGYEFKDGKMQKITNVVE